MSLPDSSILTNIIVPGRARPMDALFEKKYIMTRGLENRLYSDEEVMRLPEIYPGHTHQQEWELRKRSSRKLIRYLAAKGRPGSILEVGCGNGWLSHHLAGIPGSRVTGLDINFTELQQAARVFSDDPNLHFVHGDLRSGILGELSFRYIVFAASVQYFPSFKKIVHLALSYLDTGGELHITDTHFYKAGEIDAAKRRTQGYYASLGYPEMADFYFHHDMADLQSFDHRWLSDPHSIANRIRGRRQGFPWIRIKK